MMWDLEAIRINVEPYTLNVELLNFELPKPSPLPCFTQLSRCLQHYNLMPQR
jgi:hypothetical protein